MKSGQKHSKETKDKISKIQKGKPKPWMLGNRNGMYSSTKFKKGMIAPMKGRKFTKEHIQKVIQSRKKNGKQSGKNHYNWKGGILTNPYPAEFNAELKLRIRTRDKFTCCLCGKTEREELEELNHVLCVNHIDFDKNNCNEKNLNTLCVRCNIKINREREYWTDYFRI